MSTEQTSLGAWKMAVKNRNIEQGLIFHSDRGVQYSRKKFVNVIDSYKKISRSMSRKGNCWDNAVAESFFKSIKTELIYGNKLIYKKQIDAVIDEAIASFDSLIEKVNVKKVEDKKAHFKQINADLEATAKGLLAKINNL